MMALDEAPAPRPSERPTTPTLAPPISSAEGGTSNTEIIELSASMLEPIADEISRERASLLRPAHDGDDEDGHAAPSLPLVSPSSSRLATRTLLRANAEEATRVLAGLPKSLLALVAARSIATVAGAGLLGAAVVAGALGASPLAFESAPPAAARVARAASEGLTPLGTRTPEAPVVPPAGGCSAAGPSRMLASRAHLPTGLDVSVLESGFGIGFASSAAEAMGVRVDGSLERGGERVRVRGSSEVKHVAVEAGSGEVDDGEIELRIDADDSRTVALEGEGAPVRLRVSGGFVTASSTRSGSTKTAWLVPGQTPRAPAAILRAAPRDGGGAVVVLRRGSSIWVGFLDHDLAPEGALVPIVRAGATIGTPAITASGGGAVLAWAERKVGDKDWTVAMASIGGSDDASREVRVVGPGMSPSVAAMPDGDILLAYAVGGAGAHRVMARRLSHGLAFRGDAVAASPASVNAGQPVAAVGGDGRGIVAFFGAATGRAAVLATPLVCDPGI